MLVALTLPMMLGASALVIDFGRIFVERRSLQQAADAAALAAAQRLRGPCATRRARTPSPPWRAPTRGRTSAARQAPRCRPATPSRRRTATGSSAPVASPDRVEVIVTENVPTLFGGIVGKRSFDVKAHAVAKRLPLTRVDPGQEHVRTSTTSTPGALPCGLCLLSSSVNSSIKGNNSVRVNGSDISANTTFDVSGSSASVSAGQSSSTTATAVTTFSRRTRRWRHDRRPARVPDSSVVQRHGRSAKRAEQRRPEPGCLPQSRR